MVIALAAVRTLPAAPTLAEQPLAAPRPAAVTHPLQAQLRTRFQHAGEALIQRFTAELNANLQALLAEARHAAETRAALDLGQSLSLQHAALERGFMQAIKARFDPLNAAPPPGLFDLERLCLLPTEDLEEHIVLGHLTQEAEQRAGEAGRQLVSRLQWAARDLGVPALATALTPDTLPSCFAHALHHIGLDTAERLMVLRLVQSHALPHWPALVDTALTLLDELGLQRPRSAAGPAAQDSAPLISAATVQTLKEARAALSASAGPEKALAETLLQAIAPPFGGSTAGLITALAGAWMDSLLAEPELPPAFAPDLESLRLVVIKSALCDPSFFTQPLHPVRQGIEQLAQQAAFVGLQGYSLAPLRRELKDIAGRVSIHGQFAADALRMLPPLAADLGWQFRQQMEKDHDQRREALLRRVRALATREIDARTLDVNLPTAARAALTRGFMPLLCTLMLRHGAAAPPTRRARQLLERFVDSFALCSVEAERSSVLAELSRIFTEVGLPAPHAAAVCRELETAYAELAEEAQQNWPQGDHAGVQREIDGILSGLGVLDVTEQPAITRPAAPPMPESPPLPTWTPAAANQEDHIAADAADPLATLLQVGHWFRVHDAQRGDDRWLAVSSIHRDHDRVSFSGFDGQQVLAMRISQLADDLATGRAEPLNPPPAVAKAWQALRARVQIGAGRLQGFG